MTKKEVRLAWYPQRIDGHWILFKHYVAFLEEEAIDKWVGNFTGHWIKVKKWVVRKKMILSEAKWPKF